MSSGAYVVAVPFYLIAALGESVASDIRALADTKRKYNEQISALRAQNAHMAEAYEQAQKDMALFHEALGSSNFRYSSGSFVMHSGEEKREATECISGFSVDDIMFAEIDTETHEITYVILDYSELISVHNARNSRQFKKLALASDLIKQTAAWRVKEDAKRRVNDFIETINGMLENDEKSFEDLKTFVEVRLPLLEKACVLQWADEPLWQNYCAACAMMGKRPEAASLEKAAEELGQMLQDYALSKYLAGARKALLETFEELGMTVSDEYVLDNVSGALLEDGENPGYTVFVSDTQDQFIMEVLDTGKVSEKAKRQQYADVCGKRKQAERIMREKGYDIRLSYEDDESEDAYTQLAVHEQNQENRRKNSRRRRKYYQLENGAPKLRAVGGEQ